MVEQTAMSETERFFLFAHRANIQRYEKLLRTRLTDHERAFIERRIDEERQALARLSANGAA
jgi:hypothetical protein